MRLTIRNRLLLIGVLALAAVASLWPRSVTRTVREDGVARDTVVRQWNLKMGLDLKGGMHLALEIDQSGGPVANPEDALDRAETVIRSRINEFGVAEPLIQQVGNERLIVELPGLDEDPERAKAVVERSAFLEFRITDMESRFDAARPTIDAALRRAGVRPRTGEGERPAGIEQLLGGDTTAQEPADSLATDSASAETAFDPSQPGVFSSLLFQGAVPGEFRVPEEDVDYVDSLIQLPAFQRAMPRGLELLWSDEVLTQGGRPYRPLYAVDEAPIITGDYLSDAQAQIDPTFNQAVVNFDLNRSGARIFGRATAAHVGDHMAIVLDGVVQGTPPVIRSQITRSGRIELGNASIQDAQDLALVLRAGALPAPLRIVEERTVGPSLGEDSIRQGAVAGIVALLLVITVMVGYYRLAGVFAVIALAFYVLFTLGGLAMFNAALTLPGLAAIVLSIGLAVDANVIIFERIREELALQRSARSSVDAGFRAAMPAIIDGNVTTVITAAFLFQFGTGPIRGFAVTLIIGIAASMLSAIFVSHTFFLIWLNRRSATAELPI